MTNFEVIGFFGLCLTAAFIAALCTLLARQRLMPESVLQKEISRTILLFDGDELIDASATARTLLSNLPGSDPSWGKFQIWATRHFPNFSRHLSAISDTGAFEESSPITPGLTIRAQYQGGIMRFELFDSTIAPSSEAHLDTVTRRAIDEELSDLRRLASSIPNPAWRENQDGTVTWVNAAALHLAEQLTPKSEELGWPITAPLQVKQAGRCPLVLPSGETEWYLVTIEPLDNGRIIFAQNITALVQTEQSLSNFMQTLTKTFAQLSIGLAIFDRKRRLQVFNPALAELTALPPELLISRPTLFRFLDAMRDEGMLPEPKDYKAWRQRVAAIEASANDGKYEETLHLASGATYRLTGRPHPDGALALMFQDISDEIGRTRRMRADLELGQSVIDTTDEAIAVFSTAGLLVISNTAYAKLWGYDPSSALSDHTVGSLAKTWAASCSPTPFWEEAGAYISRTEARSPITRKLRLNDGRGLICRLAPLAGGTTLVGFAIAAESASPKETATSLSA